jgi:hypothetical protein
MPEQLESCLEQLKSVNVEVRRRLELAELQVQAANGVIKQLATLELLSNELFLGEIILHRPYSAGWDETGTGQIIQAALAVPWRIRLWNQ